MPGIATVDPATLGPLIENFVGSSDAPRWTPTYVALQGKTVLVVTVEAPQPGDRIFTLKREFKWNNKTFRSGIVFVRKHGQTAPADDADLDALQVRLLATRQPKSEVSVGVIGEVPLCWIDLPSVEKDIRGWVTYQSERLLHEARAKHRQRMAAGPASSGDTVSSPLSAITAFAQQLQALQVSGVFGKPDQRTLDEFISEVERWSVHTLEHALPAIKARYFRQGHDMLRVQVHNPTARFLPDVEVKVSFAGDVNVLRRRPEQPELLPLPRRFGEREPPESLFGSITPISPFPYFGRQFPEAALPRQRWLKVENGVVVFHVGDLRQDGTETSDKLYLLLNSRPPDGLLEANWKATIRDQDRVLSGTVQIPVVDAPLDIEFPLPVEPEDDPDH